MFSFVDIRLGLLLAAAVLVVRGQGEDDGEYMIFTPAFTQMLGWGDWRTPEGGGLFASDLRSKSFRNDLRRKKCLFIPICVFKKKKFNLLEMVIFPSCGIVLCLLRMRTVWCPEAKDALKQKRDADERKRKRVLLISRFLVCLCSVVLFSRLITGYNRLFLDYTDPSFA